VPKNTKETGYTFHVVQIMLTKCSMAEWY